MEKCYKADFFFKRVQDIRCAQRIDAVGWAAEEHPACKKLNGAMLALLCLGQSADLHMA